jgi:hypothetical protein
LKADLQSEYRRRLEMDAVPSWEKQAKEMLPYSGSETFTRVVEMSDPKAPGYVAGGIAETEMQVRQFQAVDGAAKAIVDSCDKSGTWNMRTVYCVNSQYAFVATQTVKDGDYSIIQYGNDETTFGKVRGNISRTIYVAEMASHLAEQVQSKDFHFISGQDIEEDKRHLVRMEFTFVPLGKPWTPAPLMRRSKILLDPSNNWRIVSAITESGNMIEDIELQYALKSHNLGDVSRVVLQVDQPTWKVKDTMTFVFSPLSHEAIPASEFLLSSVHIPEVSPKVSTEPGSVVYEQQTWSPKMVGTVLVAIAALFYFLYLWKRHSKLTD